MNQTRYRLILRPNGVSHFAPPLGLRRFALVRFRCLAEEGVLIQATPLRLWLHSQPSHSSEY